MIVDVYNKEITTDVLKNEKALTEAWNRINQKFQSKIPVSTSVLNMVAE